MKEVKQIKDIKEKHEMAAMFLSKNRCVLLKDEILNRLTFLDDEYERVFSELGGDEYFFAKENAIVHCLQLIYEGNEQ